MTRCKVVYVDHVARLSGAEIALSRLLPSLESRVDIHVILGEDGPLVTRLGDLGVSVEVLPIEASARDLRKDTLRPGGIDRGAIRSWTSYVATLRRRLCELDPDLIHTNSLKAAIYGGIAGRAAGVPVVWHIRDRIAADYLPSTAVHVVRAAARVLPTAIIANSQTTLDTLPRRRRRAVVANSIAYDAVERISIAASEDAHPCRIGMIGRLTAWKGQDVFLDAFATAFPDGDVEGRLVGSAMFGEDRYADTLRAQVTRLGLDDRVSFRGFREDVFAELAELDVLVHASVTAEPFGQVVLEGMAAGVPVIASNAGGPAEIITDGVDGLLVTPGNIGQLATAMRRLVDDPELRDALSTAGHTTAASYTAERTADQVYDVYDRVLRHRR